MKILINNIHSTNSTSLVLLLKRIKQIPLTVYGSDTEPAGYIAASNLVDRYVQAPPIENAGEFTSFLVSLCSTESINMIIPSSDKEVRFWAEHAPNIPVKVFYPERMIVELFNDKLAATQEVNKLGIETPPIINHFFSEPLGKVIFRKRTSVSSQGIEVVDFSSDKYIPNRFNEQWFSQEFISGTEYAVDVFCDRNGTPKLIIPRKKIEMRAGATFRSQLINHRGIIEACQKLYRRFKIPGFSDVEFIEADNRLYFIEMNLRFSASAICGVIGSFNYLEQYLEHFFFEKPLQNFTHYMSFVCWNSIVTRYYEDSIHFSSDGRS